VQMLVRSELFNFTTYTICPLLINTSTSVFTLSHVPLPVPEISLPATVNQTFIFYFFIIKNIFLSHLKNICS